MIVAMTVPVGVVVTVPVGMTVPVGVVVAVAMVANVPVGMSMGGVLRLRPVARPEWSGRTTG